MYALKSQMRLKTRAYGIAFRATVPSKLQQYLITQSIATQSVNKCTYVYLLAVGKPTAPGDHY